jgi:hypothetical protein
LESMSLCSSNSEVEHQLELGELHDRKVGGLLAIENVPRIDANLAMGIRNAGSAAHEASDRDKLAEAIARRQPMTSRQLYQAFPIRAQERTGTGEQCVDYGLRSPRRRARSRPLPKFNPPRRIAALRQKLLSNKLASVSLEPEGTYALERDCGVAAKAGSSPDAERSAGDAGISFSGPT